MKKASHVKLTDDKTKAERFCHFPEVAWVVVRERGLELGCYGSIAH